MVPSILAQSREQQMADKIYIHAPPLNEERIGQLRGLLFRYVAHHAAGLVNVAIDRLVSTLRKDPKLIEHVPSEPITSPKKRSERNSLSR